MASHLDQGLLQGRVGTDLWHLGDYIKGLMGEAMVEGQQESTLTKVAGHSLHVGVVPLGAVNVWPAVCVNEQLAAVPARIRDF
jgi:hypothetical protein